MFSWSGKTAFHRSPGRIEASESRGIPVVGCRKPKGTKNESIRCFLTRPFTQDWIRISAKLFGTDPPFDFLPDMARMGS
jgi:hypothetical protein